MGLFVKMNCYLYWFKKVVSMLGKLVIDMLVIVDIGVEILRKFFLKGRINLKLAIECMNFLLLLRCYKVLNFFV